MHFQKLHWRCVSRLCIWTAIWKIVKTSNWSITLWLYSISKTEIKPGSRHTVIVDKAVPFWKDYVSHQVLGSWLTTCLGKSCSFGLPRVPFVHVNCCQFMFLVIFLLVLRAGYGLWLYQFLIIAYLFTLPGHFVLMLHNCNCQAATYSRCLQYPHTSWIKFSFYKDTQSSKNEIMLMKWAASWQNQHCGCAPSEDSDQPGRMPRLIWVFAGRTLTLLVLSRDGSRIDLLFGRYAFAYLGPFSQSSNTVRKWNFQRVHILYTRSRCSSAAATTTKFFMQNSSDMNTVSKHIHLSFILSTFTE